MVFTENQATQFYVAKGTALKTAVTDLKDAGDILVNTLKDGSKYIQVKGADTVLRSALINPDNLLWIKGNKAANMARKLKEIKVSLDANVNGGAPIAGQDYTMHVMVRQYQGISDELNMVKTAAVHVTKGMTAQSFYEKMKDSLVLNFKRELNQLFDFEADTDGVTIREKDLSADWKLGLYEDTPVYFSVYASTVYLDGDEVSWADEDSLKLKDTTTEIGNGKKIADMEYFFAGEKGDQYRQIGWPNYVPTKYLVDPTKEYNTLNIHFAYVGANEGAQKSEQEIMIVAESAALIDAIAAKIIEGTNVKYDNIV